MPFDRRAFLKAGVTGLGALWATGHVPALATPPVPRPVRVRGRVTAGGRGLRGVAVSDGLNVVVTAADGTYELISNDQRPFIFPSVPAGYRIPVSQTGTAHHYAGRSGAAVSEGQASFDLVPLTESDERHTFLLLADIQTQDRQEMSWFHRQSVPDMRRFLRDQGRS